MQPLGYTVAVSRMAPIGIIVAMIVAQHACALCRYAHGLDAVVESNCKAREAGA